MQLYRVTVAGATIAIVDAPTLQYLFNLNMDERLAVEIDKPWAGEIYHSEWLPAVIEPFVETRKTDITIDDLNSLSY